ncbi:MAG: hypothetical protein HZB31_05780 [Nitrospirae bacterium]|nr:hypothetical protein [Nitrospirota bacterium]
MADEAFEINEENGSGDKKRTASMETKAERNVKLPRRGAVKNSRRQTHCNY